MDLIRFIRSIVISFLLISLASCQSGFGFNVSIDWVDFVQFNNIGYIRIYQDVSIDNRELTYYDSIKYNVADNVHSPGYRKKNGDAAFLKAGTPVYTISGYTPEFRLAIKQEQKLLIYEADTNPNARKGSDLLDIGGKVEYIGVNSGTDGTTELAVIKDAQQVEELIQLILDVPVDQSSRNTGSEQYFLAFHLNDETITTRSFWLDTGLLSRGIQLPEEFGTMIRAALNTY